MGWEKGQWETGHFKCLRGDGTLCSLGNGTFYPLGTILSSGNRTTYPLGIGPFILWDSEHPLDNETWETGHAIPWETGHVILWDSDHLSSEKHHLGIGF